MPDPVRMSQLGDSPMQALERFARDDAQHHLATVAGLLRLRGEQEADDELTAWGNELAACVKRLRIVLRNVSDTPAGAGDRVQ